MKHDGHEAGNDCDSSSYLMSPTLGSGKTQWSPCSQQYLHAFLKYLIQRHFTNLFNILNNDFFFLVQCKLDVYVTEVGSTNVWITMQHLYYLANVTPLINNVKIYCF